MRTLIIGIASLGLLVTAPAFAHGKEKSAMKTPNIIDGQLLKVDSLKHKLTLSTRTGEQDLNVSSTATIVKDGDKIDFDQLKEGDQIRATYDGINAQASKIEVNPKPLDEKL